MEDDQYNDQTTTMTDDDENNEKPYPPGEKRKTLPATKTSKLPTHIHTLMIK